jgi:hypothetical protein
MKNNVLLRFDGKCQIKMIKGEAESIVGHTLKNFCHKY